MAIFVSGVLGGMRYDDDDDATELDNEASPDNNPTRDCCPLSRKNAGRNDPASPVTLGCVCCCCCCCHWWFCTAIFPQSCILYASRVFRVKGFMSAKASNPLPVPEIGDDVNMEGERIGGGDGGAGMLSAGLIFSGLRERTATGTIGGTNVV